MAWQRLSVRLGMESDGALSEGIPSHLAAAVQHWLQDALTPTGVTMSLPAILKVAVRARVPISDTPYPMSAFAQLLTAADESTLQYLTILDAALSVTSAAKRDRLRELLSDGGCAWTVSTVTGELERVVDETVRQAANRAMAANDQASKELAEAWTAAYGVSPNPSDVWDHSIKAAEAALIDIVVPTQANATLGHVIGHLSNQGAQFKLAVRGADESHDVRPLVEMLKLLWPNADRHGGGKPKAEPALGEAQAVLHCAITIVQWARAGAITKR